MSIPEKPSKAVVSVVEMSALVALSKSRFHALTQAGIFPRPIRHASCKRPVYDLVLQQECLDIRRTGIGANGQPVLFNRKRKAKFKNARHRRQEANGDHTALIEALKSLGLTTTPAAVEEAVGKLYADGYDGMDQGEVIRRVFLHVQHHS